MTQGQFLQGLGHALVNFVFVTSLLFPVVTGSYWPWWRSWWGRNIVGLEICIAATLMEAVLYIDFGIDNIALRWTQIMALSMVGVFVAWRAVMIWRTQRDGTAADNALLAACDAWDAAPTVAERELAAAGLVALVRDTAG